MDRAGKALEAHEEAIAKTVEVLFGRQRDSILDRMKGRAAGSDHARMSVADLTAIFQRPRWIREFRQAIRPDLERAMSAAGTALMSGVGVKVKFDSTSPAAVNFLRGRAQRFAEEVNETTWAKLKDSLSEGMESGETMKGLASRVEAVMGDRIRSSASTIARSEALAAYSGGSQIAATQTGLDLEKTWLSALDDRVRDEHRDAHGQTVKLDEPFVVGGESGMFPGDFDDPSLSVNCRCTVVYSEAGTAERIFSTQLSMDSLTAASPIRRTAQP